LKRLGTKVAPLYQRVLELSSTQSQNVCKTVMQLCWWWQPGALAGLAVLSARVPIVAQFHDIAGLVRRLRAKIVHEPDCPFDDVAELP